MPEDQTPPPAGHNNPPIYRETVVEDHNAKAAKFLDAGGAWIEVAPLKTDEQASKLADFIAGIKEVKKAVDEDRKVDKKPHDEAGKAVQAAYTPILTKLDKAIARVNPIMTAWLEHLDAKEREENERARREAEAEAKRAAEMEAQARARNDFAGEAEAEEANKRAEKAQKDADRAAKQRPQVKSATGGGRTVSYRTYWEAEVENLRAAFMHFHQNPEVAALFKKLAEAEARSKDFNPETDKIPGVNLKPRRVAA